ncbi:MAG: hypothetical protein D6784_07430 [Chloroflexi bacterium]|nr:MAG: hypothetical protein D6784_07430 [Chloroflexota bacterium]
MPRFRIGGDVVLRDVLEFDSVPLTDDLLQGADCCVIITGHRSIDYNRVVQNCPLVIDTVNATRNVPQGQEKIIRLGAPA